MSPLGRFPFHYPTLLSLPEARRQRLDRWTVKRGESPGGEGEGTPHQSHFFLFIIIIYPLFPAEAVMQCHTKIPLLLSEVKKIIFVYIFSFNHPKTCSIWSGYWTRGVFLTNKDTCQNFKWLILIIYSKYLNYFLFLCKSQMPKNLLRK